jgi:hypothetical protein
MRSGAGKQLPWHLQERPLQLTRQGRSLEFDDHRWLRRGQETLQPTLAAIEPGIHLLS